MGPSRADRRRGRLWRGVLRGGVVFGGGILGFVSHRSTFVLPNAFSVLRGGSMSEELTPPDWVIADQPDFYDAAEDERLQAEIDAAVQDESSQTKPTQESADEEQKQTRDEEKLTFSDEEIDAAYWDEDIGDARLFCKRYRGEFLYDNTIGDFYSFVKTHWEPDVIRQTRPAMFEIAELYGELALRIRKKAKQAFLDGAPDESERLKAQATSLSSRCRKLKKKNHIKSVLSLAGAGRGSLGITGEEWNKHGTLLPCQNGVIDLETGKLLPGDPWQYFSKFTDIPWNGLHAEAPTWERMLTQTLCNNAELRDYFDYFVGACACGIQTKDFFCALGASGDNGKSLIFETIMKTMGSFSGRLKVEALLEEKFAKSSSGPSPDILALKHLRILMTSELEQSQYFSLSKIKMFTSGGDVLSGRDLNQSRMQEFIQTHSLVIHTNRMPQIRVIDQAFLKRLKVLPFSAKFVAESDEVDIKKHIYPMIAGNVLTAALDKERPGILAYVVRCAMRFLRNNALMPAPPDCVLAETQSYKNDQDEIGLFLDQCCTPDPDAREQMKDLYAAFKKWSMEERNVSEKHVKSMKIFGIDLANRPGLTKIQSNRVYYDGVRINDDCRDKSFVPS